MATPQFIHNVCDDSMPAVRAMMAGPPPPESFMWGDTPPYRQPLDPFNWPDPLHPSWEPEEYMSQGG
jgi:hypothetical protein